MAVADPSDAPVPLTPKPQSSVVPVFRTYASDVAKLTGKPLPVNVKNEPAPAAVHTPVPSVVKVAEPPATPPASKPVPTPPTPAPTPTPEPPVSYEPPPATIIPKAPTTDESRDAVLARLRARAAPQAAPAEPIYSPIPRAPSTNESREAVLARLRARTTPSVPVQPTRDVVAAAKAAPLPEPIHTYTSDFKGKSEKEGATKISMLAAEQDARSTPPPHVLSSPPPQRLVLLGAGILLILAGIGSVYAAVRIATGGPPIPEEIFVPSLIFADEREEIEGEGRDLQAALAALASRPLANGEVLVVYRTAASTTEGGLIKTAEDGGTLIQALSLPAPGILLRSIESRSLTGIVAAAGEGRPFFILSVSSYERSFGGMLEWEDTMSEDLAAFFPPLPDTVTEYAATGTTAIQPPRPAFEDQVIENRDVRVLRDGEGRIQLLYGYYDKRTLLIVRSPEAFSELVTRLQQGSGR